jgi:hypothetical protein
MRKNSGACARRVFQRSRRLTQATLQLKSVAAARSTRAAASPLQQTPNAFGVSQPEGVNPQDFLEGEIQAATKHSEIIPRAINYAEAQVINHRDVSREPKFETGPKLAEDLRLATEMFGLRINKERVRRSLRVKDVSFATAENRTDASPSVRRKTRARDWITQCESA